MTTNFPTSLDALTNPTGASSLTSPDHAGQHADINDAVEALEAKVGVDSSAVTSSLDYKINNINASNITSGTLPDARLSFSGAGVSTGDVSIEMGGSRTASGNCYIDMHATNGTDFQSRILRLTGVNGDFSFTNTGTGTMSFEQGNTSPINFKTNSTSRIYVDTSGRVGVNTLSPQAQLDVQASTGTAMRITNTGVGNSFVVEDSASTDSTPFIIDASGNVGVGKTPITLLDVNGTARALDYNIGTSTKSMPRGVVAHNTTFTGDANINATEKTVLIAGSFTAVSGRIYKVTCYEPQISSPATAGVFAVGRIRINSLTGTILNSAIIQNSSVATGINYTLTTMYMGSIPAGTVSLYYTLASTGTFNAQRSSTAPAFIVVEDLGTL